MRTIKKSKPKNPTILQQQSNKLKQKLQLLKQQVSQKKQQKQMNKTATSLKNTNFSKDNVNKFLTDNTKSNTHYPQVDTKLQNALIQMKIQGIEQKLKEKGVKNYANLLQLTEEQIDQWKDILVGYRIKLKKFIKTNKQSVSQKTNNNAFTKKNIDDCNIILTAEKEQIRITTQVKERNIEDIIKQRQITKVFIPLDRQIEEIGDEDDNRQITEEDQDVIIQSFMDIFQPRKGILKNKNRKQTKAKRKNISWSKEVQKMQKEFQQKNYKKYPKQTIIKDSFIYMNTTKIQFSQQCLPQNNKIIKYCWKCFRKINIKQNIGFRITKSQQNTQNKYFCSEKCQQFYEQEFQEFQEKIQENYSQNLTKQNQRGNNYGNLRSEEKEDQQNEDIQTIDLSIL